MMEFILLTLSIMVAILLASGVSVVLMYALMSNEKVMNWYLKWVIGITSKMEDLAFDYEFDKEEEKEL